ncbi:hypothetical protein B296_00031300, partial [Ensete ventricosum]
RQKSTVNSGNQPSTVEIDRRRPILAVPLSSGRSAYRSAAGPVCTGCNRKRYPDRNNGEGDLRDEVRWGRGDLVVGHLRPERDREGKVGGGGDVVARRWRGLMRSQRQRSHVGRRSR